MSGASRAVFLSYASQDADAARRICEALRAAGVEVWFDQSELRGGDAWDAKIRKQIKECALFVPIVSANTQARREGYFRLEWRLADQRTHLMSHDTPFIVPVVIDETRDHDARVPESFLAVQWTRLPDAGASARFAQRVRLLVGMGDETTPAPARSGVPSAAVLSTKQPRAHRRTFAVMALMLVLSAVVAFLAWRRPAASPIATHSPTVDVAITADAKAIAILPFESPGGSPDSADFTAGIHEEILTAVGRVAALKVTGRTSVLPYADAKSRNLREIASVLRVGSVVEGSVRRAGNRVKISVHMTDAHSGRQLWGDSYERELTDVFAIQSAIAREVAGRLNATLTASERALLDRQPTANAAAYELYLRAQRLRNDLVATTPLAEWEQALRLLEDAVAADPAFVQAQALLVQVHSSMYWFPLVDPSPERYEKSKQALARLRRIAPSSPETALAAGWHAALADLNWAEARRQFETALPAMPNHSELLRQLGTVHFQSGRYSEALAVTNRAFDLDPLLPQNAINLAGNELACRRFPNVVALAGRFRDYSTDTRALLLRWVAVAQFELDGDRARLVRTLTTLPATSDDRDGLLRASEAALVAGDFKEAAKILDDPRLDGRLAGGLRGTVAMERALLAHLLGRPERARACAVEAEAQVKAVPARSGHNQSWSAREQPYITLRLAQAAAFRGEDEKALQLARDVEAAAATLGGYDLANLFNETGRLYALLGARDQAFASLRVLMTGPSGVHVRNFGSPRLKRIDPCWVKLASDPRFDEILKGAKPL